MAQPTQEFPPWLSPVVATVTDAAGIVATETSIEYIAPTYFGPSIPLGSLYSFGGSTEPATIQLPGMTLSTTATIATSSTTATPSLTTTLTTIATPTTSVSVSSSAISTSSSSITSAIPTTTSSSSAVSSTTSVLSSTTSSAPLTSTSGSSSSTIPSISTSTSSTPSSTSTSGLGPAAMAGLSKGQLVGVIVASILGLIFLFVLFLFLYLWCRGRRNRRHQHQPLSGIEDDYFVIESPSGGHGGRVPGEGSPRHSGEEHHSFLQSSSTGAGAGGAQQATGGWARQSSTARSSVGPSTMTAAAFAAGTGAAMTQTSTQAASRPPVTRVPPPPASAPFLGAATIGAAAAAGTAGSTSSTSTASHASGFGVLLDRPSLGVQLPSHTEHSTPGSRPLSEADMRRIGRESVLPDEYDQYPDDEYTGAYAYSRDPHASMQAPRLVGASGPLLGHDDAEMPFESRRSTRDLTHQPSLEESATLLTARRVKVEDLGPRVSPQMSPTSSDSNNNAYPNTSTYPEQRASGGGFLGHLGLGGLATLGRMSWFKGSESPRPSEQDFTIEPFLVPSNQQDIETGAHHSASRTPSRALLSPTDAQFPVGSFGQRPGSQSGTYGVGPDGTRPHSSVSARSGTSGGTLYHDAPESVSGPSTPLLDAPSTPLLARPTTPLLAAPPRALTPAGPSSRALTPNPSDLDTGATQAQAQYALSEHAWLASPFGASALLSRSGSPPEYEDPFNPSQSQHQTHSAVDSPTSFGFEHTLTPDILDMPAPPALTHFASISSIKETPTGSSVGYKGAPFPPPGLDTIRPIGVAGGVAWAGVGGGEASPLSAFRAGLNVDEMRGGMEENHGHEHGVSIDVLEEAPPDAESGWRSMSGHGEGQGDGAMLLASAVRGTFGTYVPAFGAIMSEQGSLHSMRSHFTPSTRSTGSAPVSRRDLNLSNTTNGSISSSNSSARFSATSSAYLPRSQGGSSLGHYGSATAQTLVRHGSVTNDDRRRGVSPALSAFGIHQSRHGLSHPASAASSTPSLTAQISSPSPAHIVGGLLEKRGAPMMTLPQSTSTTGPTHRTTDSETLMDLEGNTSFETVRAVHPSQSLSPLSANFPLTAPWTGTESSA